MQRVLCVRILGTPYLIISFSGPGLPRLKKRSNSISRDSREIGEKRCHKLKIIF